MTLERSRATIDGIGIAWARALPADNVSASPLVFLHGLGSSSREFLYLAGQPGLRDRTLLFVDFPGCGESDKPDDWSYEIEAQADLVTALLREVSAAPVALVGHSMGGSIAIAAAHRHPGIVQRLVVAEPALDPGTGTLSRHIARQTELGFVRRGYRALVYQTQRQAARGDLVAGRFLVTLRQASPIALHRSAVSLRAERTPTFREQLESLTIPRTLVWGASSPPLDPSLADPGIAHAAIADAGHTMMVENPEGFADAVHRALGTDDEL